MAMRNTPIPDGGSDDDYDVLAAAKAVANGVQKYAKQRQLADVAANVMKMVQQNQSAITGGSGSAAQSSIGSSGANVAPTGVPAAPAEDPLATLITSQKALTAEQIAALMKQIQANYANFTGDINSSAMDWLKQLLGANFDPNDPNYAAMMADPAIAEYMAAMEQLSETADLNQVTDLNWFVKQQQIYQQYLDSLGLLAATETGGSGGGGGGGGFRRRGRGGGSGDDNEIEGPTEPFEDQDTDFKIQNVERLQEFGHETQLTPGAFDQVMAGAEQLAAELTANGIPTTVEEATDILNSSYNVAMASGKPQTALAQLLSNTLPEIETAVDEGREAIDNNAQWEAALGIPGGTGNIDLWLNNYANLTGNVIGDNPETDEIEFMYPNPEVETFPILEGMDQALVNNFAPVVSQFFNPEQYDREGAAGLKRDEATLNSAIARRILGLPMQEGTDPEIQAPPDGVYYNPEGFQVDANGNPVYQSPIEQVATITPESGQTTPLSMYDWIQENVPGGSYDAFLQMQEAGQAPLEFEVESPAGQMLLANRDNPVIESFQAHWQDPNALRFWFEDTYPALSPDQRELVNTVAAEVGLDVPNSAQAAAMVADKQRSLEAEANRIRSTIRRPNIGDTNQQQYILESSDAGKFENALENAGRYSLDLDQIFGQTQVTEDNPGAVTDTSQLILDSLGRRGKVRPDLMESLQNYSVGMGQAAQTINPAANIFENIGLFFNPNAPTQEELNEDIRQQAAATHLYDVLNQLYNPHAGPVQMDWDITASTSNTATGTVTGQDEDTDLVNINQIPNIAAVIPTELPFDTLDAEDAILQDEYDDTNMGMGEGYAPFRPSSTSLRTIAQQALNGMKTQSQPRPVSQKKFSTGGTKTGAGKTIQPANSGKAILKAAALKNRNSVRNLGNRGYLKGF